MGIIEFEKVSKSYTTDAIVISELDLIVEEGEFLVLLGESGCGKTTLLKMINRMTSFDTGFIRFKGKPLSEWDTVELRRSIGYVIQNIGLFPHMNLKKNITYVLDIMGKDSKFSDERAKLLIELVGLDQTYLDKYPREISGGQKQRIGVARALAADPSIILMDEPFGAVDEVIRSQLQDEMIRLHHELKKTIIFVTHDILEAMKLGTKIVLMNEGKIEQIGTPMDLVLSPANDFVKNFLGTKGFVSIVDTDVLNRTYNKVLNRELSMEEVYKMLES